MPKTIEQARTNLEASIPLIRTRYVQGVEGGSWADKAGTDQAEQNYAAGVNAAASQKRRQAGIRRVGDAAWKAGALGKGANAIESGIRNNLDKYASNFGPILTAINRSVSGLSPRTLDANANIDARVKPVVKAAKDAAMARKR